MNRWYIVEKEFNELFDRWSANYDHTVSGADIEYREVFKSYDDILQLIAFRAHGRVIEFGVGTGNLTKEVIKQGHHIKGVEPSKNMRAIAQRKLPQVVIEDGHFLDFPFIDDHVDTVVSSYAFHHITDREKDRSIDLYKNMLNDGGRIIFADTIFIDKASQDKAIRKAKDQAYHRLAKDLQTEYYTTHAVIDRILRKHGFLTHYEKMNDFVWLIEAKKERT